MVQLQEAKVLQIGDALLSIRAAIDLVGSGAATRVTVHAAAAEQLLPAARALARAAGVWVEPPSSPDGAGSDIVLRAAGDHPQS